MHIFVSFDVAVPAILQKRASLLMTVKLFVTGDEQGLKHLYVRIILTYYRRVGFVAVK